MLKKLLLIVSCLLFASCAANQTARVAESNQAETAPKTSRPNPKEAVKLASLNAAQIKAGAAGQIELKINVVEPFHVNSNPPSEPNFIPLEIKFADTAGVTVGKPVYPQGAPKKFEFSDKPLSVYTGEVTIKLPVTIAKTAAGLQTLNGELKFQPCDDEVCYPPQTVVVALPVMTN